MDENFEVNLDSSYGGAAAHLLLEEEEPHLNYSYLSRSRYFFYFFLQVLSATLSLIGSATIIHLILIHRKKRWEVYHRLLLALSAADIMFDITIMLQFPMVRKDTGHPLAIGNIATCSMIGFLTTWTFSMVNLFFVILSIYFLLTVRYGRNEAQVRTYIEPYGYIFAIGLPLGICIAALFGQAFNPVRIVPTCFLRPYPSNCYLDSDVPCQRGENAVGTIVVFTIAAMSTMLVGIICTWLVYWTVHKQQSRNLRYSFQGTPTLHLQESNRKRMRTISRQAICYTAVFLNGIFASMFSSQLEGIFSSDVTSQQDDNKDKELSESTVLAVFMSIYMFLCPLQGILNLVIYIRPTYMAWREMNPHQSRRWAVRQIFKGRRPTISSRISHLVDGNVNEHKAYSNMERDDTSRTFEPNSRRSSGPWRPDDDAGAQEFEPSAANISSSSSSLSREDNPAVTVTAEAAAEEEKAAEATCNNNSNSYCTTPCQPHRLSPEGRKGDHAPLRVSFDLALTVQRLEPLVSDEDDDNSSAAQDCSKEPDANENNDDRDDKYLDI